MTRTRLPIAAALAAGGCGPKAKCWPNTVFATLESIRTIVLLALALSLLSCAPNADCRPNTILVNLTLTGDAVYATSFGVSLTIGSATPRFSAISHNPGVSSGRLQIDLSEPYQAGQEVTITITADGASPITGTIGPVALAPTCTALSLAIGGVEDMAIPATDVASPCGCATGCSATTPSHCLELIPLGQVNQDYNLIGLTAMVIASDTTFNTDTGQISGGITRAAGLGVVNGIGFRYTSQPGSTVRVGVFAVAGLILQSGIHLRANGAASFALASSADVTIDGVIDGSCVMNTPGPGGSAGGAANAIGLGAGGGPAGTTFPVPMDAGALAPASGGAGGGFGDQGGPGGLAAMSAIGAINGDLTGATFVLVGGSGGGGGGGTVGGHGGAGGGAIQLAVNGAIKISGTVHAGGCGGQHGGQSSGGGGGGAGGAIVIEAASVTLTSSAVLAANGGGGGGGGLNSVNGGDASASTTPAPSGAAGMAGTAGGNGGASAALPGQHYTNGRQGVTPPNGVGFSGGGGGGVGRILIRAQTTRLSDFSIGITPDPNDLNLSGTHPTVYGVATFQ